MLPIALVIPIQPRNQERSGSLGREQAHHQAYTSKQALKQERGAHERARVPGAHAVTPRGSLRRFAVQLTASSRSYPLSLPRETLITQLFWGRGHHRL